MFNDACKWLRRGGVAIAVRAALWGWDFAWHITLLSRKNKNPKRRKRSVLGTNVKFAVPPKLILSVQYPLFDIQQDMSPQDNGCGSRRLLLIEGFLRLVALISPFAAASPTAIPPSAALWTVSLAVTLLIHRFGRCAYYITWYPVCQEVLKKIWIYSKGGSRASINGCIKIKFEKIQKNEKKGLTNE